jgi:hypothetical protein
MFIYGSILIAVTFSPVVFKSKPVDEAKDSRQISLSAVRLNSRTNDTLPDTTNYTSGHQYELGHGWSDVLKKRGQSGW